VQKQLLLETLDAAKREIGDAEADLGTVLRGLEGAVRAEKTTISAALEDAFAKLGAARERLVALEHVVETEPG
jgi:hypothetical protein